MSRFTFVAASSLALFAAVAACTAGGDNAATGPEQEATEAQLSKVLDVNDVSVLFPLKGGLPQPAIAADDKLLNPTHFASVLKAAQDGLAGVGKSPAALNDGPSAGAASQANWKIVGFRFDPCAPGIGLPQATLAGIAAATKSPDECKIQLRLIAQPFINGQDFDSTAHLVFQIGASTKQDLANAKLSDGTTLKQVVDRLVEIKTSSRLAGNFDTSGQPLEPHTGLNNPATAALVTQFVSDMVAKATSRGIAFMGVASHFEPWVFVAGVVGPDKQWHQIPLAGNANPQVLRFTGGAIVDPPNPALSVANLFGSAPTAADRALAFKIESGATHFFNTDCVSCHSSSARVLDPASTFSPRLGDGPEATSRQPAPKNVTAYVTQPNAQTHKWNTRNFGYFSSGFVGVSGKPTVSQRTANETGEIVAWINLNIIKAPEKAASPDGPFLQGPGKDCTNVDDAVFKCLRDGKVPAGQANCFSTCSAAPTPEGNAPVPTPPISEAGAGRPTPACEAGRNEAGACN